MADQRSFAGIAWTTKGKLTRRERFLAEMDAVIPWKRLTSLIEPYYPKRGRGRPPLGLEEMHRIYFLQHWFDLSDPAAEDAIYVSESMRRFVGIELRGDKVPDESSILRFRHAWRGQSHVHPLASFPDLAVGAIKVLHVCREVLPGPAEDLVVPRPVRGVHHQLDLLPVP
jgi:hypothetical protein